MIGSHIARAAMLLLAIGSAFPGAACRKRPQPAKPLAASAAFAQPSVTINKQTWYVELATTPAARYQGLSWRTQLPAGAGMLFVYPKADNLDYCMRGCLIPLDIAFISPELRIVAIHTMTVEEDLAGRRVYSSVAPAQFVLEVPAGSLAHAGAKVGDLVQLDIPDASKALSDPGR